MKGCRSSPGYRVPAIIASPWTLGWRATIGYQHAANRNRVRGVLMANRLCGLLDAGYAGGTDGTRGGYLITFRNED